MDDLTQQQGRQGILGRHFEHDGGATGDRGRQFMRGQQNGKVEGDDRRDGREREATGDSPAPLSVWLEVHGDHLAPHPDRLLRALAEHEDCAIDLRAGQRERLPRFDGKEASQRLSAFFHAFRDPVEYGGPGMGWQRGGRRRRGHGGFEGRRDVTRSGQLGAADQLPGVRAPDFHRVGAGPQLAAQQEGIRAVLQRGGQWVESGSTVLRSGYEPSRVTRSGAGGQRCRRQRRFSDFRRMDRSMLRLMRPLPSRTMRQ